MKRRDFIAGGCAVPLVAGAGLAVADEGIASEVHPETGMTYKDMYWNAQKQIDDLEQEVSELRTQVDTGENSRT